MLNAHDAHLPSFSLYDDALMTMPSEKGRIVAGNEEAWADVAREPSAVEAD
jgi:hypothetical protein